MVFFLFGNKLEACQAHSIRVRSGWHGGNNKNNRFKAGKSVLLIRFDMNLWALYDFGGVDDSYM